mgnify:CR=1 FL=1
MIGCLPTSLQVNDKTIPIRSDYRVALTILEAYNDDELKETELIEIVLACLYTEEIELDDYEEAFNQAIWFLNCGDSVSKPQTSKPLYSWEQDEQMIFSAINKVAGKEIRQLEYLHFWTFIGLFNELGEGLFSTVVSIRKKKQKGQKLEKWEKEFCIQNPDLVTLKKKYTKDEQDTLDWFDKLIGAK